MSQEQLGFEAKIHRTEIGFLERGDRDPQLKTLVRLAGGLDVPLADLLDGIGPRRPSERRGATRGPVSG